MALASGTRLGPYEVVTLLGAGGMGEVYRARDTKLNRDVALKILPDGFTLDGDRIARFRREAQVLASLNHPNIAAIYGFEDSGSTHALVLELVEGPTLADRIANGPIPLDEALPIAKQITEALEAAHDQGIIHRDLKPANIKVRDDGTVKVLDFGLAKAFDPTPAANPNATNSPTLSAMATQAGIILGTAAYMAPEQAKGKPVDRRADIWGFGVVLYEVLTVRRAFGGRDVSETLAFIITKEPDWSALPSDVPSSILRLLRRCLEKEPKRRLQAIGDARIELDDALANPPAGDVVAAGAQANASTASSRRLVAAGLVGSAVAAALIATVVTRAAMRTASPVPVRFAIVPPLTQPLLVNNFDRAIAISPDGRYLAYVEGTSIDDRRLMLRSLDRLDAMRLRPIGGQFAAVTPFFDPGSRWIGFFEAGELKKMPVTGGPPITICKVANPRGASWGPNNTIVFGSSDPTTGLMSVSAAGGEPKVLTTPDAAQGERDHLFPFALADAVLFTITGSQLDSAQVAVLDMKTGRKKVLVRGGNQPEYVDSGHLVYAAGGRLWAVRFDPIRLDVLSEPVPVVDGTMIVPTGAANFDVARGGTLVYVRSDVNVAGTQRLLVWVDRLGKEEPINAPPRTYDIARISPDGTRVALDVRDQDDDIWVFDLARQTLERRTFDPAADQAPVWTPDGRALVFRSNRGGGFSNLYRQPADGSGAAVRLTRIVANQTPNSVSPDGALLAFSENAGKTGRDIEVLDLKSASAPGQERTRVLVQTPFSEGNAEISPDGRWIAYVSNESGKNQVYVRPFPNADAGRWQVSSGGGTKPLWSRNGRELFYINDQSELMAVPVQTSGTTFGQGNAAKLFAARYFMSNIERTYDVSPDGQRFLMIKIGSQTGAEPEAPPNLVVVEHWSEELKQRVPVK